MNLNATALMVAAVLLAAPSFADVPAEDPAGVLKQPIPDKLVVLTFDDGVASHSHVVVPILAKFGFKGSFYVCDFDSFRTRKDWYLTWRQMKAMSEAGFEIGNHTSGHAGGANIEHYLSMEDALIANHVPKPTTVAWPLCQANPRTYPDLAANGYTFGRGGYERPYRPTVDHPFDVPGMAPKDVEGFVRMVRQAAGGKVVVLIYHGVPDIEHPGVSLDPAVFRAQMKYLKDNRYTVIALKDLARYVDPAKASRLPPTSRDSKPTGPDVLAGEETPAEMPTISAPTKPATKESVAAPTTGVEPSDVPELDLPAKGQPITLDGDRAVTVPKHQTVVITGVMSGPGKLVKNGAGLLQLPDVHNTYSGGTLLKAGSLMLLVANHCLGSGPLTLYPGVRLDLERVDGTNRLIVHGGEIYAGNGFGCSWNADIVLHGDVTFLAYNSLELNRHAGGISGSGGLTMAGTRHAFGGYANGGRLTLSGTNTYTGPTRSRLGTLLVTTPAALHAADPAKWTPHNIRVHRSATLALKVGGPDEFTGRHIDQLLGQLTDTADNDGLMGGGIVSLDTSNAKSPVVLSGDLRDARGPDGTGWALMKAGEGMLVMAGKNTFTGPTVVERGMLSVSSLNSVGARKTTHGGLGVPADVEAGEILLGDGDGTRPRGDGGCGLIYTGAGETSDRVVNLAGRHSTVTFEQAGTGLFKLTSTFVISGYGADKQIVLAGDTAGRGELAGDLFDPHDRAGRARTSVVKTGSGTWTLSGNHAYTGPTLVKRGTLRLTAPRSVATESHVQVAEGATLELDFDGEASVAALTIAGQPQSPGAYSTRNAPAAISGKGSLIVR